jgi:hypothetical protein
MIEMLPDFPENVIAFAVTGHVTRKDYDDVVIPKVKEAFGRHRKVRCYCDLGPQFPGIDAAAAWEDFKLGVEHRSGWDRMAIVTDVDWIRLAINLFRFLVPGEIRIFPTSEAAEARRWIAAEMP